MTEGSVCLNASGELCLTGELDYRNGPALREAGRKLVTAANSPIWLDCSAVERSSSVGLSLVLAYMRDARSVGKELRVRSLPAHMQAIAGVCGLEDLLSAQSD